MYGVVVKFIADGVFTTFTPSDFKLAMGTCKLLSNARSPSSLTKSRHGLRRNVRSRFHAYRSHRLHAALLQR